MKLENKNINTPTNKQDFTKRLWEKVQGKMFFTNFGNTEYAGYFIEYDNEGGEWIIFQTADSVRMTKKISTEKLEEVVNSNKDYF